MISYVLTSEFKTFFNLLICTRIIISINLRTCATCNFLDFGLILIKLHTRGSFFYDNCWVSCLRLICWWLWLIYWWLRLISLWLRLVHRGLRLVHWRLINSWLWINWRLSYSSIFCIFWLKIKLIKISKQIIYIWRCINNSSTIYLSFRLLFFFLR